jgi:hypothetical protein
LRDLGASITGSEFIKYQHGPVPSRGEKHLRHLVRGGDVKTSPRKVGGLVLNEVQSSRKADLAFFSKDEKEVIDAVCGQLGHKSAVVLSDISHKEPAWHYAGIREKLSPELIAYGCEEDAEGL